MKRIISVLFVFCMFFSLIACGSESTDSNTSNVSTATQSSEGNAIEKIDVVFKSDSGESKYNIIYPEKGENGEDLRAGYLYKQMKDKLGINPKKATDSTDGTDAFEILVGETNRAESAKAMSYMFDKGYGRRDDFIICSMGKKIIINANNTEALTNACQYFVDNFLSAEKIVGGIEYISHMTGDFKDITVNGVNIGRFVIVRPHYNSSYITQIEIDNLIKSVFDATGYELKLKEDAYCANAEYEIVVGNTNRQGIEKISNYDLYNVTVSGKKVYLNGGSTYSTAVAVSEFAKLCASGAVTDASSVKNGSYKATYTANYDSSVTYRPVWTDEFDGDSVDTSKWDIISEEYNKKGTDGLSGQNGKRAWRNPDNVVIRDGYFHSVFTQDEGNYYSGTLRTYNTLIFKYGYVEMSSITPQGSGFWSTLWMSSANVRENMFEHGCSMEVDIAENFGNSAVTNANAHVWPKGVGPTLGFVHRSFDQIRSNEKKYSVQKTDGKLLSEDFHTFGFLWTQDYIAFTADGKIYCDLNLNDPGFEDYKYAYTENFVNLRLAGTAGFSNCPLPMTATEEEWANTNQFIVDYVHIYQLNDGVSGIVSDAQFEW